MSVNLTAGAATVSPIHAPPDPVPWGCGGVGDVTGWGKVGGIPPELYSPPPTLQMIRCSIKKVLVQPW